jgi:hypothetical protein
VPTSVRLGGGFSLVATGAVPRVSLLSAAAAQRADEGRASLATALAHLRALARAPADEDAAARRQRQRAAYDEACASVPEESLARHLHSLSQSAGAYWELQRRLTSQLGLHALLSHALSLRNSLPGTVLLRRDTGCAELVEHASRACSAGCDAVPFRLTRLMQHFVSPLGIDGAFSGAICAASECLAHHGKCPLPLWLDALSRPEEARSGSADLAAAGVAEGVVPWGVDGEVAAARVRELSPVLATRGAAKKADGEVGHAVVDVHQQVRSLVNAATSPENLWGMPSSFQAWL